MISAVFFRKAVGLCNHRRVAYIVLAIMKMPDTMLLAVIIGVTNVIPFFGPFMGAVRRFIIVVLQNPVQGLCFFYFYLTAD